MLYYYILKLKNQINNIQTENRPLSCPVLYTNNLPENEGYEGHFMGIVGYIDMGTNGKNGSILILNDPNGGVTKYMTPEGVFGQYQDTTMTYKYSYTTCKE